MRTEAQEVQLMGTEEQVKTAKRLIEDFVSQHSGLSWLLYSFFAILHSFDSMHSKMCDSSLFY